MSENKILLKWSTERHCHCQEGLKFSLSLPLPSSSNRCRSVASNKNHWHTRCSHAVYNSRTFMKYISNTWWWKTTRSEWTIATRSMSFLPLSFRFLFYSKMVILLLPSQCDGAALWGGMWMDCARIYDFKIRMSGKIVIR